VWSWASLRALLGGKPVALGTKTITVEEAAAAIRKNGFKKKSSWGEYDSGKFVAGCALAQGGVNLGCTGESLREALNAIEVFDGSGKTVKLGDWIMSQNDNTSATVGEIGLAVEKRTRAIRLMEVTVTPKAYTI
jgi:hypothetical protein